VPASQTLRPPASTCFLQAFQSLSAHLSRCPLRLQAARAWRTKTGCCTWSCGSPDLSRRRNRTSSLRPGCR